MAHFLKQKEAAWLTHLSFFCEFACLVDGCWLACLLSFLPATACLCVCLRAGSLARCFDTLLLPGYVAFSWLSCFSFVLCFPVILSPLLLLLLLLLLSQLLYNCLPFRVVLSHREAQH